MNYAYLLTGGNLGDREENLKKAIISLGEKVGKVLQVSPVYETAAWGGTDQPDYLNQALLVETSLSASELLHTLLDVEKQLGRFRQEKYGARVIDIDILFFNDEIIQTADLVVPHPHIQNRRFVLAPMAEIAPDLVHPVLDKTIIGLLEACPDPLNVKKFRSLNAV